MSQTILLVEENKDNRTIYRVILADASTAKIPIIIIAVNAMVENRDSAFVAGGDAFLAKPVQPKAVAEQIRRLLASTPESSSVEDTAAGPR